MLVVTLKLVEVEVPVLAVLLRVVLIVLVDVGILAALLPPDVLVGLELVELAVLLRVELLLVELLDSLLVAATTPEPHAPEHGIKFTNTAESSLASATSQTAICT